MEERSKRTNPPTPAKRTGNGESFLSDAMSREAMESPDTSPATMKTLSSPSRAAMSMIRLLLLLAVVDDESPDLEAILHETKSLPPRPPSGWPPMGRSSILSVWSRGWPGRLYKVGQKREREEETGIEMGPEWWSPLLNYD